MSNASDIQIPLLRNLVRSAHLDIFGALLIFGVCVFRNFHGTYYYGGELEFGVPLDNVGAYLQKGAYPLGIMATVGAVFSMLATRFTGKQNNTGNIISVVTTVNSGANDFLFGNRSALITYPVSFLLHYFAVVNWSRGETIKKRDLRYYLIIIFGICLGFILVYLGAYLFGGKVDTLFLVTVSIAFGLSVGANFANIFKYQETWLSWMIYNIFQLVKNIMLYNLANVVKYIFYLFNAVITFFDWTINGEK